MPVAAWNIECKSNFKTSLSHKPKLLPVHKATNFTSPAPFPAITAPPKVSLKSSPNLAHSLTHSDPLPLPPACYPALHAYDAYGYHAASRASTRTC